MNKEQQQELESDRDGLLTYEYIANHIDSCGEEMDWLVDNMIRADQTGQFMVSASRYLAAIDKACFSKSIERLVSAAIDKDRERRYIGDLLESLYGADYKERTEELNATDNNFRRIYKRVFPKGI